METFHLLESRTKQQSFNYFEAPITINYIIKFGEDRMKTIISKEKARATKPIFVKIKGFSIALPREMKPMSNY